MMVLQKYSGDNAAYQYVEEPSKHGSFLEDRDDGAVENKSLTPKVAMIKMLISMSCFGVLTLMFKLMF